MRVRRAERLAGAGPSPGTEGARFELDGRLRRRTRGCASAPASWTAPRASSSGGTSTTRSRSRGGGAATRTTWPASSRRASAPRNGAIVQVLSAEYRRRQPAGEPGRTGRSCSRITSSSRATRRTSPPAVEALRGVVARKPGGRPGLDAAGPPVPGQLRVRADGPGDAHRRGHHVRPSGSAAGSLERENALRARLGSPRKGELAGRARRSWNRRFGSNPGSLVYLEIIGYLLALLGDWERGIALSRERAMERNPHHLPHVLPRPLGATTSAGASSSRPTGSPSSTATRRSSGAP